MMNTKLGRSRSTSIVVISTNLRGFYLYSNMHLGRKFTIPLCLINQLDMASPNQILRGHKVFFWFNSFVNCKVYLLKLSLFRKVHNTEYKGQSDLPPFPPLLLSIIYDQKSTEERGHSTIVAAVLQYENNQEFIGAFGRYWSIRERNCALFIDCQPQHMN